MKRKPILSQRSATLMLLYIIAVMHIDGSSFFVKAFKYVTKNISIRAPEMLCLTGTSRNGGLDACPRISSETMYEAILMDENGYVTVKLRNIIMTDEGRRRSPNAGRFLQAADQNDVGVNSMNRDESLGLGDSLVVNETHGRSEEADYYVQDSIDFVEDGNETDEEVLEEPQPQNAPKDEMRTDYEKNDTTISTLNEMEEVIEEIVPEASEDIESPTMPHHLQVYLVSLDEYASLEQINFCCYELEFGPPFPIDVDTELYNGKERAILPKECSLHDPKKVRDRKSSPFDGKEVEVAAPQSFAHDYRMGLPRVGTSQAVTAPIYVNMIHETKGDGIKTVNLHAKFRPKFLGRHMVVISNCAVEITYDPATESVTHQPITAKIEDVEVLFASKFGELPLSMMGIIPFYGIMLALYSVLSLVWWKRSHGYNRKKRGYSKVDSPPLLDLQYAIRLLVFMGAIFSAIAFAYYLDLNGSIVDIDVLYSGTAAALVNWGPFSMIVATSHFATIFGCQLVVTLATDGTWLIQKHVRQDTKNTLYLLAAVWVIYFCFYGFLSPDTRTLVHVSIFLVWVVFLLINIRRSLRHLRSLVLGQSTDMIMAVGGALVAKRSIYRRMCAVVAIYPIIFLLGWGWSLSARPDSWTWVGYVLCDIYLFVLLLHGSILCLPRSMASQEFIKYAPLEVSVSANDDSDLWEVNVNEEWDTDEIEMSHKAS